MLTVAPAFAATITWSGAGDGVSFANGNNWVGGVAPGSADDAVIGVVAGNPTILISTNPTVHSLTTSEPVSLSNALSVNSGVTLNNTTLTLGTGGQLTFTATQTLGGTGNVVLAGGRLYIDGYVGTFTLTIGANVTITATQNGQLFDPLSYGSLVNKGTINANTSGATLTVNDLVTVNNQGTMEATNGGILTVNNVANSGTLNAAGSTLNLGGTLTTASLGTLTQSGTSTVNLTGTLNNTGATLALTASTGSLTLAGGTITGGTVTQTGGAALLLSSGTLTGFTLAYNTTVTTSITVNGGLTLANNATLTLGTGGQLTFTATQTLGGTGNVVLAGGKLYIDGYVGTFTLTIGSGITITATQNGQLLDPLSYGSVINQGTIDANTSGVTLTVYDLVTVTNQGTMEATNGGILTVVNVSNSGTLNAAGSTLNLGGSLTTAGLGTLTQSGTSTVNLTGTLNNTGATLALTAATGSLTLAGGTITGGTVTQTGGAALLLSSGTLTGFTLAYNTTVTTSITVNSGLTLANNATLTLGTGGQLTFTNTQTLGGTGNVVLAGGNLYVDGYVGTFTLTIGSGVTITATQNGRIFDPLSYGSVINQGTINANTSGATLTVNDFVTVTNQGTMEATNGGILTVNNVANSGTLNVASSTLNLGGTLTTAALGTLTQSGTSTVNLTGTLNNTGATLALTAATGSLTLAGGTITGGTVTQTGGAALLLSAGTLTGFTLAYNTTVTTSITVNSGLTLANNAMLTLGTGGQLTFTNTQTLGGTGNVVLAGGNLYVDGYVGTFTLTIGSGVTITATQNGHLFDPLSYGSLINQGTINANTSGATLTVNDFVTVNNQGTMEATNGGILTVNNVANSGTLNVANSTLNLGGTLTTAGLGTLTQSGISTVNLTGTLNNTGATLALTAATGSLTLAGGTITGGTVTQTGGAALLLSSGTLTGFTLAYNTTVTTSITVNSGLTLANNATLTLGTGGQLTFTNTQTLGGTGNVVLAGGNLYVDGYVGTFTLTIGAGVTITATQNGHLFDPLSYGSLINQGTINANTSGATLTVNDFVTVNNQGTMEATNGGILTVVNVANSGTLNVAGSTLNLGGTLTTAGLGTLSQTGTSTVNLTGTLNNTGATLALTSATGSLTLAGGTITGGTVTQTGGAALLLSSGTLTGFTLAYNTTITTTLTVNGGLTLANNATLTLGTGSQLTFTATQTLGGTGSVVLAGGNLYVDGYVGTFTLTIGSGITITATQNGHLFDPLSYGSLVNQGTINANTSGATLTVNDFVTVNNQGTMEATNGGVLSVSSLTNDGILDTQTSGPITINGSILINNPGILEGSTSGNLNITGNLLGNTQNAQTFSQMDRVTFKGAGTSTAPQLVEAMSQDGGAVVAGLRDNFAYGTFALANNTYAELVDQSQNSPVAGAQSVYARLVIVPAGTTLNLNGLHFYAQEVEVAGTVLNGTIMQIPNSNAPNEVMETLTIQHNFGDQSMVNDGLQPGAGLIQGSDGYLYGVTPTGGSAGKGSVFRTTPLGQVLILHSFGDNSVANDGVTPAASLMQAPDGNFYGTTSAGGSAGKGAVFKITTHGAVTVLHSFGDNTVTNDGASPTASLVQGSDGNFYGTTPAGGSASKGTVFAMTPLGAVTILHSFGDNTVMNDGASPGFNLVQAMDGKFYGTTSLGGAMGAGTVFRITAQGVMSILHSFQDSTVDDDGSGPMGGLVQATDGNLYGTTQLGGSASLGCAFNISTQGYVTILYSFGTVIYDGLHPASSLLLGRDGFFYGATTAGGSTGNGTLFQLSPQGLVTVLHSFGDGTVLADGNETAGASSLVQASDGNFYGATSLGGTSNKGVVFKLALGLPEITSAASASGNVSLPFTYQATATNETTTYAATNLPAGLSIDANTGLITGAPSATGTAPVTLTLTNAVGTSMAHVTITIMPLPPPAVTSILYAFGSMGSAFSYQTMANNNTTSYAATGLSAAGLSIDPATGIISGVPSAMGTFPVSLTATNATGAGTAVTLNIQIFASAPTLSQEYVVLHRFNNGSPLNDGQNPFSIFQGFDGTFFGSTLLGGANGAGTLFNLTNHGIASILYAYSNGAGANPPPIVPEGLIQGADGNFYGVTEFGGTLGTSGNFFRVTPQGIYMPIYDFNSGTATNDGANPQGAPVQGQDGGFYGVTTNGGTANLGTIYKITAQGLETILHSFGDSSVPNDGTHPGSSLIQASDGNFYGTTPSGGVHGNGTVFKITTQGVESILCSFGAVTHDGANPAAGLIQGLDGNFYGTTQNGGVSSVGTVFKITPLGVESVLYSFGAVTHDGANPLAALIQGLDGNFYGTTKNGGSAGLGTIFQLNSSNAVTIVHNFGDNTVANDGANPAGSLYQDTSGNFYGTTLNGGSESGTAFVVVATETTNHLPIFTGAAAASGNVDSPLSYTPKALFGVSGAGAESGNSVQPSDDGIISALVSLLPQVIHKDFSQTNWTLTGTLPNYLTFDSTSGTISGTPTQAGTFTVVMTPHNALGEGNPETITLFIDVPPIITSLPTAGANTAASFDYVTTATAFPTLYGATDLPGWLYVNTATGLLSGAPPGPGTYAFNAIAGNYAGNGTQQIVLTVTGGSSSLPTITSTTSVSGTAGTPFTYQIAAMNTPTSFSALSLPVGLLFDPTTGLISGTPTTASIYSVPVYATNGSGTAASELTITISQAGAPSFGNSLSAQAMLHIPFSYQIPATGLVDTYSAIGLPDGLSLDATTGVISGTPSNGGTFPVSLLASNATGEGSATLSLTVVVPIPMTFSQWGAQYPGFSGGLTDTSENDGLPNLLKYVFNINPTVPVTAAERGDLPTPGIDSTTTPGTKYLTLTYRQYASLTDVTPNLQTSTDLHNWTTVTPAIDKVTGADPDTGDPIMEIGVVSTGSKQFIRLDVTSP